jgi:hypothetical protein
VIVLLARKAREVEDDDEVDLSLVRTAVLQQSLKLSAVSRLCTLALFPDRSRTTKPWRSQYSSHAA